MISYVINAATAFFAGGTAAHYALQKDENTEKNKKDDDRATAQIEKFHQKCRSYSEISTLDNKKVDSIAKEVLSELGKLQLNEENINDVADSLEKVACQSKRCKRLLYKQVLTWYCNSRGTPDDEELWYTI